MTNADARAAVQTTVQISGWGGPDVLELVEGSVPAAGPGQVLVRTHAAGLNPVDWKVRAGRYSAAFNFGFPMTLGRDFSGTVVEVGPEPTGAWQVGDEVAGTLAFKPALGAYSTHLLVEDAAMVLRPAAVSVEDAAALPVAAMTAYQALHEVAHVEAGQKVLVQAGAGGVGHLVIQLAKAAGCEVTATCSPNNIAFVTELGADHAFDYTSGPFEDVLGGFDVVVDGVGGDVLERSYRVLKPGGIAVTMPDRPDEARAAELGVRVGLVFLRPDAAQLADLLAMVAAGTLSVHVDASYPLAAVADAHTVLEAGHVRGKLVLTTR